MPLLSRHRRRRGRAAHPQPDDHLLLPLLRSGRAGPAPLHSGDADLPRCLRTATSNKQETIYCYSEAERDAASAKLGGKPEITRFKGLGEISPAEFKQFIGKDMRVRCLHTAIRGIRVPPWRDGQRADSHFLHGQEHARAERLHHGESGGGGGGVGARERGIDPVR